MNASIRRFGAILIARNKEFYRDTGALGWTILFPILMVISFAFIFDIDHQPLMKGIHWHQSSPPEIPGLKWIATTNLELAKRKLQRHKIDLLYDDSGGKVSYWLNSDSTKSQIVETLLLAKINSSSTPNTPVIRSELQGRKIKYIDWLFPGLICMNVMWMALWGVGWVVVRQRKLGVLKRLKASPVKAVEYLSAQLASRLLILVLTGIFIFVFGHLIYPFQTLGSYLDLFIVYVLGCLSMSSFGLIIAARITSDELASGILNLIGFPMMFLSEIWFSLEGSAPWVHKLAYGIPLWHMTDAMRRIITEGASISQVWDSVTLMLTISVIFLVIGSSIFKWIRA